MTTVPVPGSIARVSETSEGLEIVIPAKRQVFATLFLLAWLCGWAFGEVSAIRQVLDPKTGSASLLFLVFWLVGWTLGGGFALASFLWMLMGRERVTLRPDALVIRQELGGLGRTRAYELASVSNLRVSPIDSLSARRIGLPGFRGPIAFDYGSKTLRFADSIDEAEARQIVAQMRSRHAFRES